MSKNNLEYQNILDNLNNADFGDLTEAIVNASSTAMIFWNNRCQPLFCNTHLIELFGVTDPSECIRDYDLFSPEYQPNEMLSKPLRIQNIKKAFKTGYLKYKWLHCKLNGEEIPCEITLIKLNLKNKISDELVLTLIRDLRPKIIDQLESDSDDKYFVHEISDRMLFNALANLSDELSFILDMKTETFQLFGKGLKNFFSNANTTRALSSIAMKTLIHKDDFVIFDNMIKSMKNGIEDVFEFRILFSKNVVKYHRIVYQAVLDPRGQAMFCIGKATDIENQKILEFNSTIDLLTDCYNKITTENLITARLKSNLDNGTLFIIDMDYFKSVNDNLGHHYGDKVLAEIGQKLKRCFRSDDIVGRLGGDEFIVFASAVSDKELIEEKANHVLRAFKNSYTEGDITCNISGSIGVARFPLDGKSYKDLYIAADKALYNSKYNGRNCYTLYTSDLTE